jgi:hypothetical protein
LVDSALSGKKPNIKKVKIIIGMKILAILILFETSSRPLILQKRGLWF